MTGWVGVPDVVEVHMSHGRWCAKCPNPACRDAEYYGHRILDLTGRYGGLDEQAFRCAYCGHAARAVWPAERAGIEQLMADRWDPATRNWRPGEALHDLLAENVEHGALPAGVTEDAPLRIIGDHVTDGNRALPVAVAATMAPRRSLEG